MAVYRYTAAAEGAALRRGELAADSAQQVRLALRRMGLAPVRVVEVEDRRERRPLARLADRSMRSRRASRLVELYESLATLLSTGTPLTSALELLAGAERGAPSRAATLCREMAERIRHGASLADAMSERPEWFSPADTALVRSAEQTGETARALSDLAEHHGQADRLRGRIAGALAYPALLLVFGLAVAIFLTTTTLPQVAGALQDAGAQLPRSTVWLLAFGAWITTQWPIAIATLALLIAAITWALRTPRLARWRLRAPLLGPALARAQVGAFSVLLERLLSGGLTLGDALGLAAPTIPNAALRGAVERLRGQLEQGRSIASPLSETGLFDPVFCRVLEVGQESGELPAALAAVGRRSLEASRRATERLAAALEPAAILLLAAAIGFIVFAAIKPMLRLAPSL